MRKENIGSLLVTLAVFLCVWVGSNISASTTPGLVAYWNFDEGNGDTAHDSSGNGGHRKASLTKINSSSSPP